MRKFIIPGEAKGKGRPKFFRRGDFVGTYTPEQTTSYENLVKLFYQEKFNREEKLTGPVEMKITVKTAIPKSYSKKKTHFALNNFIRPTKKPDLDNIAKIIADSLNKIAYDDDKQIVSLTINKFYAQKSNVEVELKEVALGETEQLRL